MIYEGDSLMVKLLCKPCFAFEALASLVFCNYMRNDIPKVKDWVDKAFQGICIRPSNRFFDLLVSHYSINEIEAFDMNKLAKVYPLYLDENSYVKQFKSELIKGLEILRNSNFSELWKSDILPTLSRQCDDVVSCSNNKKTGDILSEIAIVQQKKICDDIYIFFSYAAYPISFKLSPNSYITSSAVGSPIDIDYFLQMLGHELCHGFSNTKTRQAYRNACNHDQYLNKVNWFLNEFCGNPGDEEEFVQAIEHTIAVKHNLETYDGIIQHFHSFYHCSVPMAILLFIELYKLNGLPDDMNEWIYKVLTDGTIEIGQIESKVNTIMPGYSDRFLEFWQEEESKHPDRFVHYNQIKD